MQEADSLAIVKKFWKNGEGKAVSAQGSSKGMLTWRDTTLYKFISANKNRNSSFVELECLGRQEKMWIGKFTVHGEKEYFLLQLKMHRYGKMHLPCIIAIYFNVTISLEEKKEVPK